MLVLDCWDRQIHCNSIMSTQLLQDMMWRYCKRFVYPDAKKLREVLTQLSDQQKLYLLQQEYLGWGPSLYCAARRDHTEIISTLLTSIQSSANRLKLLMVYEHTPLHAATFFGHTNSVKMILGCLTADQQIQIMSVQDDSWGGKTAIQYAKNDGNADTVRVLTEYQHRVEGLQKQQEQSRLHKSLSGRLS